MSTMINDSVNHHRWNDVNFMNRYNRVSFEFSDPTNALRRSEAIAKRSKTPLKKSNSMMMLRTIDTSMSVSAAPSSIDAISTDDITSASCSIDTSPVPTDSSSTGKGRRRRLPPLPTLETRQRMNNGVGVNAGGARVSGLQRKHSWACPSSSGAVNHRLIDGVSHHRSIEGVNHRVLGLCLSNDVSRLSSETINLSGSGVDQYQHRKDLASHHPTDFVNHRKSDLSKQLPDDTVAQSPIVTKSPTVNSNPHLNGVDSNCPCSDASVSSNVNQNSSDIHNLHDEPNSANSARNDSVARHKSELVIQLQGPIGIKRTESTDPSISHLQSQGDIGFKDKDTGTLQGQNDVKLKDTNITYLQGPSDSRLKDSSIRDLQGQTDIKHRNGDIDHIEGQSNITLHDHCAREMKPCKRSSSLKVATSHGDNINDFEGPAVHLNSSNDETLRCEHSNDFRNKVIKASQCISRDSADNFIKHHSDGATTFKTGSAISHKNGTQRGVGSNNQTEILRISQRDKLKQLETEYSKLIPSFSDKLNHCQNGGNTHCKLVPSLSTELVGPRQKRRQQKLHASNSLDEHFSPAAELKFQVFDEVGPRKDGLDSKYGSQSNALYTNEIAPMDHMVSRTRQKWSPGFLQRKASQRGSHFDSSSSSFHTDEDFEDDRESVCKNVNGSLKKENTFQRQGLDSWKTDRTVSHEKGSLNYLISQSQDIKSTNDSDTFSKTCQSLVHSPTHNSSTLSSSNSVTKNEGPSKVMKYNGTSSPTQFTQIAVTGREHYPLTRTKNVSEGVYRSPNASERNWTSSEDTDLISLHANSNPECSPTTRRDTPIAPPCVPTLHALLQTYRMTTVSLVRSTPMDDFGVKLTSVPFRADTGGCRRSAGLAPKGKRATKLGSPDGAFRPVAAASPGRDGEPEVVVVAGVEDGSAADADAAAGGRIEEGDILVEVNGTYVLGSTFDVIERLLNVNQQHLSLVLAKPIATTSPQHVNGWTSKTDNDSDILLSSRTVQHRLDHISPVSPHHQHPSILQHVQPNFQFSPKNINHHLQKIFAVRPTTLAAGSSKWSSESAYTIRPIKAESKGKATAIGSVEDDYYTSSDSCDEFEEGAGYGGGQKVSAV